MTSNPIQSNNWTLSQTLGTGGFGIVQLWVHVRTGEKLGKLQNKYINSKLIFFVLLDSLVKHSDIFKIMICS